MTKKELQEELHSLEDRTKKWFNKLEDEINERWEMLKEYLGVKEEEYAKLKEGEIYLCGKRFVCSSEAIKKTRLVKIKKSKK